MSAAFALTAVVSAPWAAATPDDPQAIARQALAEKAKAVQGRLLALTADYQREDARADALDALAALARSEAAAAAAQLASAQALLDRYAAATYTRGPGGSLVDLLARPNGGDALRAASYIEVVGASQSDALTRVRAESARLDALKEEAEQEAQAATAVRAGLTAKMAQLRAQATQAETALTGAMAGLTVGPSGCTVAAGDSAATPATERTAGTPAADPRTAKPKATAPRTPKTDVREAGRWGGWPNGLIPPAALCRLTVNPAVPLRADAAASLDRLAAAYAAGMGKKLCVGNGYRSYGEQVSLYRIKPSLAAVPGTSNHGWGLAVDLCSGPDHFGTPERAWLVAHAAKFGWVSPHWAQAGASRPEPWHWEYGVIS